MSAWRVILPWLLPMAALMVLSAFFSCSEAALFSLRPRDRRTLVRRSAAGRAAVRLLDDPERLLSAVLFCNLMTNVLFFGIASIVGGRLDDAVDGGSAAAVAFTAASLLMIIFFSEMVPKSLAVLAPVPLAVFVGPPLTLAVRILGPILPVVAMANLAARRLLWPGFRPEADLDLSDIERAIDLGTGDAALAARERDMLQQLVQMADTRVGEWMRPRSQLRLESLPIGPQTLAQGVPEEGYLWFTEPDGEEVVAAVALRLLRPSQIDDLSAAVEPVVYVPWSATVATVFHQLLQQNRNVAAVVNEYGETIGVVTIDDIMRNVLRVPGIHDAAEGAEGEIENADPGVWRASGTTSTRRLAKHLGIRPPEGRNVTIAGLMQRINERVPRLGDSCRWDDYQLSVVDDDSQGRVVIEIRQLQPDTESPDAAR